MAKPNRPQSLIFFYLLVVYILIQFFWWAYMIMDLNVELTNLQNSIAPNEKSAANYRRKLIMIIGEGSVFIVVLGLAVAKIQKAYKKEMDLANQQKNFLLSITHELKSPLTSIGLYLQTIQKRKLTPEKQEEIISRTLNDTNRLKVLVEKILTATRIDSSNFSIHMENTNVSKLSIESLQVLQETIGSHHQNIFNIDPDIYWKTDTLAFESILANLYENAVKYSPQNSNITVVLKLHQEKLKLSVIDQGTGIPHTYKTQVFEKFYRQGQEDTRKTKGTGLGLYIVKKLTQLLNGNIKITDNTSKGSIFTATFNTKEINE